MSHRSVSGDERLYHHQQAEGGQRCGINISVNEQVSKFTNLSLRTVLLPFQIERLNGSRENTVAGYLDTELYATYMFSLICIPGAKRDCSRWTKATFPQVMNITHQLTRTHSLFTSVIKVFRKVDRPGTWLVVWRWFRRNDKIYFFCGGSLLFSFLITVFFVRCN